jgi:hypothetical protein
MSMPDIALNNAMYIWENAPEIPFNELPQYSPWSARMLGLSDWKRSERTEDELEREFELETYAPQYDYLVKNKNVNDFYSLHTSIYPEMNSAVCVIKNKFKKLSMENAISMDVAVIAKRVNSFLPASAIVDIGAGNGRTIITLGTQKEFTDIPLYALEKMVSARNIINTMSLRNNMPVVVGQCDLTKNPLTVIDIPKDAIIYTNYVIHEIGILPEDIIESFIRLNPKMVIHFEPFLSFYDPMTIHGQFRIAYMKINKYNMEFDAQLHQLNGNLIEIVAEEENIFGMNPYLPKSMIAWRPITPPPPLQYFVLIRVIIIIFIPLGGKGRDE